MHAQPESRFSWLQKFFTSITVALLFAAFFLFLGNGGNVPWFPAPIVFTLVGLSLFFGLAFPIYWTWIEKRNLTANFVSIDGVGLVIRSLLAFLVSGFGWKKFFNLQFLVPDEILAQPVKNLSGEWLTWYYFGYSEAYSYTIATLQIGISAMLLFRKTALAGSIFAMALMANLCLINFFYGMNAGAQLQCFVIVLGLFWMLIQNRQTLSLLLKPIIPNGSDSKNNLRFSPILVLFTSLLFTIYLMLLMS